MSQQTSTWVAPSRQHQVFYNRIHSTILKEHNDLPLDQVIAVMSSVIGYLIANSNDQLGNKITAITNLDNSILDAMHHRLTKQQSQPRKQIIRRYDNDDSSRHSIQ